MLPQKTILTIFDLSQIPDVSVVTHRLDQTIVNTANQFASEKRRLQFLSGRWLLSELLHQFAHVEVLPEICLGLNGKPSFVDPTLPSFNISHSGHLIMVALSFSGTIGLDLEVVQNRPKFLQLAKHSFGTQECLYLDTLTASEQLPYFWRLWTIRESILKLKSLSVWQMKEIQIIPETNKIKFQEHTSIYSISHVNSDYAWALSSNQHFPQIDVVSFNLVQKQFILNKCNILLEYFLS
ncbi:4'-phosphopantetheinyl transferase family protein [Neisseria sp. Ec49-e6-T10]|uniref:4'-phosphopantetheinyl transferase family protein n=1 Tax=Neisseria sp. Ec49-e6-T10 TaxID=3140744 RepID=UPI003EBD33CD